MCFKQKTAYKIRNCDWSSVVCSSDLIGEVKNGKGRSKIDRGGQKLIGEVKY